jgi:ferredoxin
MVKIVADQTMCEGHGQCVIVGDDVFELNDDGYIAHESFDAAPDQEAAALRGVDACPVQALKVT